MFQCTVNNKTLPIKEWYFGVGDNYLKFIDTEYSSVDECFPDNGIITNVKITDDSQPDYLENHDVYLTRKSITVENEVVDVITPVGESGQNIEQVTKKVISVFLGTPTTDMQVNNIAEYIGYVANPDSLSLGDYKNYAINKSKNDLANYLLQHPLQSNVHKNTLKSYAITENKQILLLMELVCAQQAAESEIPYQPSWNASGESCTYDWTIDELKTLAFQINQVVKPLISYQQTVEEEIMSKESVEDIKAIVIDFSAHDPRNTQSDNNEETDSSTESQTDEESSN